MLLLQCPDMQHVAAVLLLLLLCRWAGSHSPNLLLPSDNLLPFDKKTCWCLLLLLQVGQQPQPLSALHGRLLCEVAHGSAAHGTRQGLSPRCVLQLTLIGLCTSVQ
jgi:hypothetical protein